MPKQVRKKTFKTNFKILLKQYDLLEVFVKLIMKNWKINNVKQYKSNELIKFQKKSKMSMNHKYSD